MSLGRSGEWRSKAAWWPPRSQASGSGAAVVVGSTADGDGDDSGALSRSRLGLAERTSLPRCLPLRAASRDGTLAGGGPLRGSQQQEGLLLRP